jgi:hypothetical protein
MKIPPLSISVLFLLLLSSFAAKGFADKPAYTLIDFDGSKNTSLDQICGDFILGHTLTNYNGPQYIYQISTKKSWSLENLFNAYSNSTPQVLDIWGVGLCSDYIYFNATLNTSRNSYVPEGRILYPIRDTVTVTDGITKTNHFDWSQYALPLIGGGYTNAGSLSVSDDLIRYPKYINSLYPYGPFPSGQLGLVPIDVEEFTGYTNKSYYIPITKTQSKNPDLANLKEITIPSSVKGTVYSSCSSKDGRICGKYTDQSDLDRHLFFFDVVPAKLTTGVTTPLAVNTADWNPTSVEGSIVTMETAGTFPQFLFNGLNGDINLMLYIPNNNKIIPDNAWVLDGYPSGHGCMISSNLVSLVYNYSWNNNSTNISYIYSTSKSNFFPISFPSSDYTQLEGINYPLAFGYYNHKSETDCFIYNCSSSNYFSIQYSNNPIWIKDISFTNAIANYTPTTSNSNNTVQYGLLIGLPSSMTLSLPKITITQPTSPVVFASGKTFALSATSTSGAKITFTSSNPNVISVSGATATIKGAGTTTITASVAATGNYSTASATTIFSVTPSTPTITFTQPSTPVTYVSGKTFTLKATSTSGGTITFSSSNRNVISVSGATATIKGAGTTTITASVAATANYTSASTTRSVTVSH